MKLLLDHAGMVGLLFCTETSGPGDRRVHFTAAPPARATVVFHKGLDPESLTGAVVDAESGLEMGFAGYVRSRNVGLPHNRIAIYQRVDGPPDTELSRMLAAGLQDEV